MDARKKPIDKTDWPAGVWHDEPDEEEFEHAGLLCLVWRESYGGGLCGYVRVERGHPEFGKGCMESEADCHGGITFGEHYSPGHKENDDFWWLGFDHSHLYDISPARNHDCFDPMASYKNFHYVKAGVQVLADQLSAMLEVSQ